MKKLTCREMGGMRDAELTAKNPDGMMRAGWQHLEKAHPEMAERIAKMPQDDPQMAEWKESFDKAWNEAPAL